MPSDPQGFPTERVVWIGGPPAQPWILRTRGGTGGGVGVPRLGRSGPGNVRGNEAVPGQTRVNTSLLLLYHNTEEKSSMNYCHLTCMHKSARGGFGLLFAEDGSSLARRRRLWALSRLLWLLWTKWTESPKTAQTRLSEPLTNEGPETSLPARRVRCVRAVPRRSLTGRSKILGKGLTRTVAKVTVGPEAE